MAYLRIKEIMFELSGYQWSLSFSPWFYFWLFTRTTCWSVSVPFSVADSDASLFVISAFSFISSDVKICDLEDGNVSMFYLCLFQIKAWGLSNETPWGVLRFCELCAEFGVPPPASIQLNYNLLCRNDVEKGFVELARPQNAGSCCLIKN